MSTKKNALGRGLSALLSDESTDVTSSGKGNDPLGTSQTVGSIAEIPVEQIEANPFQPRTKFEKEALLELADSIKEHGIIQPVAVRKLGYDKYQLISGERRFRASQIVGLKAVPAYIRIANDQAMLEMALVENVQRENLDAVEVAVSYQRLMDECNLTQEELGERVGKNRSTVTNYLRLLKLAPEVQTAIKDKSISMGHARAIVSIDNYSAQIQVCEKIISEDLSVRATEELIKGAKAGKTQPVKKPKKAALSFEMQKLSEDLKGYFNSKVKLQSNDKGAGKIEIPFKSQDDLQRIIDLLDL